MEKINILITSAGRRVSLVNAFQREARLLNKNIKVYCTDMEPQLSSACQIADNSFKVKKVTNPLYIEELISLCKENDIGVIIPTIDTELIILSENKNELVNNGIFPLISDLDLIEKCRDKRLIHSFFDELKLDRAKEYEIDDIEYPCFVKPFDGSRSVGTFILSSKSDLTKEIVANKKNMYLDYINPQEYKEFTVDMYFNKNSEIISIVPRERIFVRDGEVNKACTRKNSIIPYLRNKFNDTKGFRGCITFQLFKHIVDEKYYSIEINPRFGGGYPLSYLAGSNFPKWIIEEYIMNKEILSYSEDWNDNTLMLRYDKEVIVHGYQS